MWEMSWRRLQQLQQQERKQTTNSFGDSELG